MAYPWSAHDILTAADLNAAFSTAVVSTGLAAWTAYTPVWTSSGTAVSLGNGVITGRYWKSGRAVLWYMSLTMGSTTTFGTGTYSISLPVAAGGATANNPVYGHATIIDVSASARFIRTAFVSTTTTVNLCSEAGALVTNTVPMTWANTDTLSIMGRYESAS